ncbi:hypothetical protein [Massilia sp. CCM 8734]|uniref:hypothetical protein n=1 Tax=Massilia sp. CCM 8734 TaxID=2609283 RepID=UPI00141D8A9D|nr:hypothetical protein [Massilia sp. CCM 8734]NHZ98679.1 hypothetical protein [Massilia sp. CCM 8734]
MALHAGFAAALSFTKDVLQSFIHAGYVNNTVLGRIKGGANGVAQSDLSEYTVDYDLFQVEPRLTLQTNAGKHVILAMDLAGTLTCSADSKPTRTVSVRVKLTATCEVAAIRPNGNALHFGLKMSSLAMLTYDLSVIGGDQISPLYPSSILGPLNGGMLSGVIARAMPTVLLTPPQLAHFVLLGYTLGPLGSKKDSISVRVSADSLNIGVDVQELYFQGDAAQLVDLNRVSTPKGWKKTLLQSVHTDDDEYGTPLYDTQWTASKLRTAGAHKTDAAVSLHEMAFQRMFDQLGRSQVMATFEGQKYAQVQTALLQLIGKFPKKSFEPSTLQLTALNALKIVFGQDILMINGTGSNFEVLPVHVGFSLKARIVHTYFDGDTSFVMRYANADGITGEIYDVDLDSPAWLGFIHAMGIASGIMLAPHDGAVNLAVSAVAATVVGAVVGNLLGASQDDLMPAVLDSLSGFHTAIQFTLPKTSGPTFTLRCDDVLLRPGAMTAWFKLERSAAGARIYVTRFPNYTSTGKVEHLDWPSSELSQIVVRFSTPEPLHNIHDTQVRIAWKVLAGASAVVLVDTDLAFNSASAQVSVDHASPALGKYDSFIIRCRIYRPWDSSTDELFSQEMAVRITDRLNRTHRYVHWNHVAYYPGFSAPLDQMDKRHATGWVVAERKSKIHYTDPAKRCRFADAYTPELGKDDLIYHDVLPFDIAHIAQHRKLVCPYCFFGGPDKKILK